MQLTQLQSAARTAVFEREAFGKVCSSAQEIPTLDQERACDLIVGEGVKWLAEVKPRKHYLKHRKRFFAEVEQRVRGEARDDGQELVCGFGLIIGAILTWLIGRALTWLWGWITKTDNAQQLVCGMAA